MNEVLACLGVAAFYGLGYGRIVARWGRVVQAVVARTSLPARHPQRDVDATSKLVCVAAVQGAFAVILMAASDVSASDLVRPLQPAVLLLAVPLALAELALAALLCTVLVDVNIAATRRESRQAAQRWSTAGCGGWMAQFAAVRRICPWWVSTVIVASYVAGEELVFRGVLGTLLRTDGLPLTLAVSTLLFVGAQVPGMPGWHAAAFPAIGAIVVGLIHGWLFWQTADLSPLIVAHLIFMLGATLGDRRPAVADRT